MAVATPIGTEINAVRRELQRLEECKILRTEKRGNRKYFSLNLNHTFFPELMAIMHKSYGLGGDIVRNHNKIGELDFAILTSSYTRGVRLGAHDVDLVIVGQVNLEVLADIVSKAEKSLSREINYTVLKKSEFELRKKRRDNFVLDMLLGTKVLLVGSQDDLVG